jgi:hypothetical protein
MTLSRAHYVFMLDFKSVHWSELQLEGFVCLVLCWPAETASCVPHCNSRNVSRRCMLGFLLVARACRCSYSTCPHAGMILHRAPFYPRMLGSSIPTRALISCRCERGVIETPWNGAFSPSLINQSIGTALQINTPIVQNCYFWDMVFTLQLLRG